MSERITERQKEEKREIIDQAKERMVDRLRRDPEIIDPVMRPLIERLNSLPFLYTNYSCSGHVEKQENDSLITNKEPCLGVEIVTEGRQTTKEYVDNFKLFAKSIEEEINLINTQHDKKLIILEVAPQETILEIENGEKIDLAYEYMFYFFFNKEANLLETKLLNEINEGFHKVADLFEENPSVAKRIPPSDEDYLSLGPYNYFSQTERAIEAGLIQRY